MQKLSTQPCLECFSIEIHEFSKLYNTQRERNKEGNRPVILYIENISLKNNRGRRNWKHHEHLLLFLHSQGKKGNGSETEMGESVGREEPQ